MSDDMNSAPAADASLNVGINQESAPIQEGVTPAEPEAKAEAKRIRELKLKVHGQEFTGAS
jgi:hypothetical protein